jgi:expansin (peptidoglycan-binding protein)
VGRAAWSVVVVACVVVACGSSDGGGGSSSSSSSGSAGAPPPSSTFSGEVVQGVITYYDTADGSGNCGFDPSPNDLDVAAFDAADYAKSATCGECVKISGPKGTLTVRIVDQCPDCDAHHLDLAPSAFEKIADKAAGRVNVTYQAVACNVQGNIQYHFKDGSSQYWTAIQLRNHRIPIAKLEYQKGGAYVAMERQDYNYFVEASGVGVTSGLKVRVTSADGQTLEDTLQEVTANKTFDGAAQFH